VLVDVVFVLMVMLLWMEWIGVVVFVLVVWTVADVSWSWSHMWCGEWEQFDIDMIG
jgi:hypothetical protein